MHKEDLLTSALSERRKGDRAELARRVTELANRYSLTAVTIPEEEKRPPDIFGPFPYRRTSVTLTGPHGLGLTVTFDGNSCHRPNWDTYVLSWCMYPPGRPLVCDKTERDWRLQPNAFGNVNHYHGHKATDITHGTIQLFAVLERRFARIADGTAFERDARPKKG